VIVWNEYTCKVSGGTFKFVECEECKQKYVYQMVREASGQGNSLYFLDNAGAQRRANSQAQAILNKTLQEDCDPVPCPKCACYQQNMMEKLCREYRLWMYWTGVSMIFVSVLCGAFAFMHSALEGGMLAAALAVVAFLGFVGGIGVIVWRRQLAAEFEPNETPLAERQSIAEERAVKVKNFENWLKEHGLDASQLAK
jgi:hypothetical protein